MRKLLLSLLLLLGFAGACAGPGTVGVAPAKGLLEPVLERCDAYILVTPDALSVEQKPQYQAAKDTVLGLKGSRVDAAASWIAVNYICDVHDAFVKADSNLKDPHLSTYLRSTELLRKMYREAYKAAGKPVPAGGSQSPAAAGTESRATADSFPSMGCPNGSCTR